MVVCGNEMWPLNISKNMMTFSHCEKQYQSYKEIPENIYMSLERTAALFPNKKAFIEENKALTFGEFKKLTDNLSENLHSLYQVKKSDRVALLMVNSINFCIAFYALARLGAVVVPLSTKSKEAELMYPLIDSDARLLILDSNWWDNVKNIIPRTKIEKCIILGADNSNPLLEEFSKLLEEHHNSDVFHKKVSLEDPAVLMYTSGTTGVPKGALLSNFNIMHGVISYKRIFSLDSSDSTVIAVPIFHITGLAALMALFVYIGGEMVLQPYFDAEKALKAVEDYNLTFFHGSPTVFIKLLEESKKFKNLSSLKKAACGSAHMPSEVLKKIKEWLPGMNFHTVYGLTETSSPATIMPQDVYKTGKVGSSGVAIPGVEIKIVNDAFEELSKDEAGELLVKGSTIMMGYWNEVQNLGAIVGGWLKTGDIARIDSDGYLYIVDRKKDMIDRGGEKIYSIEVENILYSHPAVKEVAIIGIPDPVYGEVAKAVISLNEGFEMTEDDVRAWVKSKLAKFKVPQYVQFVEKLPYTNNGKISKTKVKGMYS